MLELCEDNPNEAIKPDPKVLLSGWLYMCQTQLLPFPDLNIWCLSANFFCFLADTSSDMFEVIRERQVALKVVGAQVSRSVREHLNVCLVGLVVGAHLDEAVVSSEKVLYV